MKTAFTSNTTSPLLFPPGRLGDLFCALRSPTPGNKRTAPHHNEEPDGKKGRGISATANRHWVGDGFPVRSLFSYNTLGQHISPFLLLDYAGPADFPPA
ncbi:hypothetical protein CDO47_35705 [Pseudomonas aeruginosa]|nr:hypothetical protein CDO47_35705 [Pseudomonas aeruginosa]